MLDAFAGAGKNHAHLPSGGGLDMETADLAGAERGCIEIGVSDRAAWLMRPTLLEFQHISEDPHQSFLMLHLAKLRPTNVYEDDAEREYEDLLELSPGEYVSREVWNRGFVDHDENGYEIPIPSDARLVTRWSGGKILIVAKGSIWNGVPATYDGRHNEMTSAEIKGQIVEALTR